MKSTAVMFLLLLSGALALSVTSYTISDSQVENVPSVPEDDVRKPVITPEIINATADFGSTLAGILNAIGLNKNDGTDVEDDSLPADAVEMVEKTLRAVAAADVRDVLVDSSPLAKFLDSIPLIGPALNRIRSLMGLTGNMIDRMVSVMINVLRCAAESQQ